MLKEFLNNNIRFHLFVEDVLQEVNEKGERFWRIVIEKLFVEGFSLDPDVYDDSIGVFGFRAISLVRGFEDGDPQVLLFFDLRIPGQQVHIARLSER